MRTHLDGEIRLEDAGDSHLYSWCLQEFNEDGEKIGGDFIPCREYLHFLVSDLTVSNQMEVTNYHFGSREKERETKEDEYIFGSLKSGWLVGGSFVDDISYRMFRSARTIEDLSFRIYKLTDDSDHHLCFLEGVPSYSSEYSQEGEDTARDHLTVVIGLLPASYDNLVEEIRGKRVDEFSVSLYRAPGFYENWRPPFTNVAPEHIKVLLHENNPESHSIVFPENCDIDPPRLGEVKEFSFRFSQKN